ncbi:MAG: TGS domain-containing protein, partial [Clostridia bacterium]|nr:TGS domain-containing protein [Clostridia bacterium]
MKITINGNDFEVESGLSAYDAARAAGVELSREIIAAEINGKTSDLTAKVNDGDKVRLLTFEDEGGAHTFRHTASHVLAAAVKRLYPETKLTIGPAIENGFYYDFDSETAFTSDVLEKLEAEMKKIVKENAKMERFTLPRDEAIKFMKDEPYKVE